MLNHRQIPINVFTGYLGSGKTTIILNAVGQLPRDYKVALLKNEFGNIAVDSQIAKEKNMEVKEMLNGCLCCILVGKMKNALEEMIAEFNPDRIIIETSGSAYPAPIALQIRDMGKTVKLDSIITVIDAINFDGYKDKSFTAKMQAQFTDIILINKHEEVSEVELDRTLDDVYDLNPQTPKIKTDQGVIDPNLIFGIDTTLFSKQSEVMITNQNKNDHHHEQEVDIIEIKTNKIFTRTQIEEFLNKLDIDSFYRIKGFIELEKNKFYIINYVAGKFTLELSIEYSGHTEIVLMGYGIHSFNNMIVTQLHLTEIEVQNI